MKRFAKTPLFAVLGFGATGLFCFGLACVLLFVRPASLSGDPVRGPVLALTHLITLGWIGSLLFAGAYMVGPILAGAALWSRRLSSIHLIFHLSGLALLVGGLFVQNYTVAGVGAGLQVFGLALMVLNLVVTGSRQAVWTPANVAFQTALFWLLVTGGLAIFMLRGRLGVPSPLGAEVLIALHAHFALLGFLAQVLLGVSSHMVPELLGTRDRKSLSFLGWLGWLALNVGLLALIPATMAGSAVGLVTVGAIIFIGLLAFGLQIVGSLWLGRRQFSWSAATHVTGVLLLIALMAGALLRLPDVAAGTLEESREWMRFYISMSLLGPFSLAILGTAGRMVPQLVWKLRFGPWESHDPVPRPEDLGREAAAAPAFFAIVVALVYLGLGQLLGNGDAVRLGALLLLIGFAWYLFAIAPALSRLLVGVAPEDFRTITRADSRDHAS